MGTIFAPSVPKAGENFCIFSMTTTVIRVNEVPFVSIHVPTKEHEGKSGHWKCFFQHLSGKKGIRMADI